ncbi:hypothetical protein VNO78_19971 [Psophocarpus tetragonolobus]|uniref:Uncharacterized protein n=1 Tax=Psophocarpus tetragonolobus TaxID=3891 RepID=A0AAN9XGR3_PSOTE
MQNNSVRNYRKIQPYLFSTENESSRAEVHLSRDRYGSNVNAQENNGMKSYIPDETVSWMNQLHDKDMEIGYEESPPPPTYEGLEQRFIDEIVKLTREKSDAEDAEIARHQERILEINTEYQEKLSSLRALQATQLEAFLRKELQARLNQYYEGKRKHFPNRKVSDDYGYGRPPTFTDGEAIGSRSHGVIEYKHDGEQTLRSASGRNQRNEAKVPLPPGRVYNNSVVHQQTKS